jgi:hypothetical protein
VLIMGKWIPFSPDVFSVNQYRTGLMRHRTKSPPQKTDIES